MTSDDTTHRPHVGDGDAPDPLALAATRAATAAGITCEGIAHGRPLDPDDVGRALAFLQSGHVRMLQSFPTRHPSSSYRWKHEAQQFVGEYVSPGAMIAACLVAGVPVSPIPGRFKSPHVRLALGWVLRRNQRARR